MEWSSATSRMIRRNKGQADAVQAVVYSPDGKILASQNEFSGEINLWDASTGLKQEAFSGSGAPPVFSPDGQILAFGDAGSIRLWNTSTYSTPQKLDSCLR
jgi:WD40 repeat protein